MQGTLSFRHGKLASPPAACAAVSAAGGHRLFVVDQESKQRFLVDSGSDLCCFPRRFLRGRHPESNYQLEAANDSSIKTYGPLTLRLNLGLRRNFTWRFTIADVSVPILGSDFLAYYHLVPDHREHRLLDFTTSLSVPCERAGALRQASIRAVPVASSFADVFAEFPDLTRPAGVPRAAKHSTQHYIRTTDGPPLWSARVLPTAPPRSREAEGG